MKHGEITGPPLGKNSAFDFHSLKVLCASSSCLSANFLRHFSIAPCINRRERIALVYLVPLEKSSIKLGIERTSKLAEITWQWWGLTNIGRQLWSQLLCNIWCIFEEWMNLPISLLKNSWPKVHRKENSDPFSSDGQTCLASRLDTAIAPTYGRASMTASAKSAIKVGSHPKAGTRPQFLIPDSSASCLYSMSISSKVSMCSLTKLWSHNM